jgi:hypothetical protein
MGLRPLHAGVHTGRPPGVLDSMNVNIMDTLLLEFEPLFVASTCLPPPREHMHCIQLLPDTVPVAVRPYRYTHA